MDKRKLDKMEKRIREMQALYEKTLEDNRKLEEFRPFMKEAAERMKTLMDYYQQDWILDQELITGPAAELPIMGQDEIYDAFMTQHRETCWIIRDLAVLIAD